MELYIEQEIIKRLNLGRGRRTITINKNWLEQKYIHERMSCTKIASLINCCQATVSKQLKIHNIPLRTMSESLSGDLNPMYGKKGPEAPFYNKKHKESFYEKMEIIWSDEKKQELGDRLSGESNGNWKGGITELNTHIRSTKIYDLWRTFCLERDDFTCQNISCGKRGGKLQVDHIKSLSTILHENNIKTIKEAKLCKEIWDFDNGRTLCFECHKMTDTYGFKSLYKK